MTLCAVPLDKDGFITGTAHQLAARRYYNPDESNFYETLAERVARDSIPYEWPTLCGITGVVYELEGLRRLTRDLADCFECGCVALSQQVPTSATRYQEDAERREARRRTWRESKRLQRLAQRDRPPIECAHCHAIFEAYPKRGAPARYCSVACRNRAYYQRRKERVAA